MVTVTFSESFEKEFRKVKDSATKEKLRKQVSKLLSNPFAGKPLMYTLKGERTLYIKPFRLIYALKGDEVILLRLRHRDEVYKR